MILKISILSALTYYRYLIISLKSMYINQLQNTCVKRSDEQFKTIISIGPVRSEAERQGISRGHVTSTRFPFPT